jgi:hypothetical protein
VIGLGLQQAMLSFPQRDRHPRGVLALATPAILAIPISRSVLQGNAGTLQGACSGIVIATCRLMVVTGLRRAPRATLTAWHAALIIIGTLVLALTTIKRV